MSNGDYIRYNNISEYNTNLCTDIIIKSKFEGRIKYYVKENEVIKKCEINDKDLLYSIELCDNPVINKSSDEVNNTFFAYEVLSDDFINKIYYLGDLVGENILDDYSLVKKGMNVYKIYEYRRYDDFDVLKADRDGIIVFNKDIAFLQEVYSGLKLFTIFKDESVLVKELFKNELSLSTDSFTRRQFVEGSLFAGKKMALILVKLLCLFDVIMVIM